MLTLAQLLTPRTSADFLVQLIAALQGIGYAKKSGTGSGSARSGGVAANGFDVLLTVTTAGGLGTAAFTVSTDGGLTTGSPVAMPSSGTYVVGATGLTLQFYEGPANGIGNSFEAGDTFEVELTVPVFPATSWQVGSAPLTQEEKLAELLEQLSALVLSVSAGGYLSTARGDWLTLLAHDLYQTDRQLGRPTVGVLVLTNPTSSPRTINAGTLWAGTLDGLRFNNLSGGVLAASGTIQLLCQSEAIGSKYNVAAGGITTLFTSLPGVSVNNPNPTGGSWITQSGTDNQTDADLIATCQAKWPSLSTGATGQVYEAWCKAASPNVTRVKLLNSPTVGGEVDIYLAGAAGGVDLTTVGTVQGYLANRISFPSTVVVASATTLGVTVTAVIHAHIGQGAAALAAITQAFTAFGQSLGVGPTIYQTKLIELLQDPPGVRDVVLTPLAGADGNGNLALSATQVAAFALALTVQEV